MCVIEARKTIGPPFIAQNITASRAICAEPGERHHVAWHHRDGKKHAIFACLMLVFPCLRTAMTAKLDEDRFTFRTKPVEPTKSVHWGKADLATARTHVRKC